MRDFLVAECARTVTRTHRDAISYGAMTEDPTGRALRNYVAIGGSLSVLTGALVSLLFPWPWDAVVWAVIALTLCTCVGRFADRFIE